MPRATAAGSLSRRSPLRRTAPRRGHGEARPARRRTPGRHRRRGHRARRRLPRSGRSRRRGDQRVDPAAVHALDRRESLHPRGVGREEHDARLVLPRARRLERDELGDRRRDPVGESGSASARSTSPTTDSRGTRSPVASPSSPGTSAVAPSAETTSSVAPSCAIASERIVWLIVSPVTSAAATIVVPSISPRTMSAVRPRRRPTLRTPSRARIGLRSTRTPRIAAAAPRATRRPTRSESTGIPKSSCIGSQAAAAARDVEVHDVVVLPSGRGSEEGHELVGGAPRKLGTERFCGFLGRPEGDDHPLALRRGEDERALVAVQLFEPREHRGLEPVLDVEERRAQRVDLKQRDSRVHRAPPGAVPRRSAPSSMRTMRSVRRPTAMSWVTIRNVSPRSRFSRRIRSMISCGVLAVEVAGRLVGPDDRRVVHERARDRDALALTARELVRDVVAALAEPDELERLHARAAGFLGRDARDQQRQLDVLDGGEHRQQVVELEDEAHAPRAVVRALAIRHRRAATRPRSGRRRASTSSRPDRQLSSVVLPQPDGPMIATISPRVEREVDAPQGPHLHDPVS